MGEPGARRGLMVLRSQMSCLETKLSDIFWQELANLEGHVTISKRFNNMLTC